MTPAEFLRHPNLPLSNVRRGLPVANAVPTTEDVLTGLRKAIKVLPASLPLNDKEGIFPSSAKGKEIAKVAISQGFLTEKEERIKTGNRTKKVIFGIITDKGIKCVVETDSPKAALEALLPAVLALGNQQQPAPPNLNAFRDELTKATATCVNAVKEAFAKVEGQILKALPQPFARLESEVLKALPAPTTHAVDPRPVLTALQHALEKVQAPVIPTAPSPTEIKPPPAVVSTPDLDGAIVAFVNGWANEKTVGCQFDVLWDDLKQRHPELTIGAFQDALRKLHEAGRIRLGGWARMLDDIPKPQLAVFVSSKVMYYAQPSQPNG
jgi:hypothetical protein